MTHAADQLVGLLELALMAGRDVRYAEDVLARAHDGRPAIGRGVGANEAANGERTARRSGNHREELTGCRTAEQGLEERVVKQVVRLVAELRVVIHHHSVESQRLEKGSQAVRTAVRSGKEREDFPRSRASAAARCACQRVLE